MRVQSTSTGILEETKARHILVTEYEHLKPRGLLQSMYIKSMPIKKNRMTQLPLKVSYHSQFASDKQ